MAQMNYGVVTIFNN